eukprot:TRINITY_DN5176_c0_g1_i1.p2 TRINITY_DN5176_c0_g1~~TRINITY_DN5176_c0_g1_i1.p2  ORF type:complete len:264 (+),score=73.44 TRINITY_DN5176_c0_g1_i1:536-1327(+)
MLAGVLRLQADARGIVFDRDAVSRSAPLGLAPFTEGADANDGWRLDRHGTGDLTSVGRAVSDWTAAGGGDNPQANLVALYRLATLPPTAVGWRDGDRRVVAWAGDSPGHKPTCIDGGRTRLTWELVTARLRAAPITVVGASMDGGLDAATTPYGQCAAAAGAPEAGAAAPPPSRAGQASDMANAAGGVVFSVGSWSRQLVFGTLRVVNALNRQLTAVTSGCDGVFAVSFDPPLPRTVQQGTVVRFNQTVCVDADVCAALHSGA